MRGPWLPCARNTPPGHHLGAAKLVGPPRRGPSSSLDPPPAQPWMDQRIKGAFKLVGPPPGTTMEGPADKGGLQAHWTSPPARSWTNRGRGPSSSWEPPGRGATEFVGPPGAIGFPPLMGAMGTPRWGPLDPPGEVKPFAHHRHSPVL